MLSCSRMVAVLLLVLLAGTWFSGMALAAPAPPTPPARCHEHGSRIPSPKPVSYQCCITGHRQALAGVAFSVAPPVSLVAQTCKGQPRMPLASVTRTSAFLTDASPGSPGQIPLRV